MSEGEGKATLRDVAKLVGCSVATVSNAINGRGRLSEEKRQEVLRCCAELNFVPNSVGRSLRLQRTDAVGVIYAPSFAELFGNVFYARIMEGLAETFGEAGIDLMLGHQGKGEGGELPRIVRQGKVDALVVLAGVFGPSDFEGLRNCPVPICLVDTHADFLNSDSLTSDGFGGGRQVADYFVRQGHRDVVMLAYDTPIYNIEQRIEGFLKGLQGKGIERSEDQVVIRISDDDEAVEQIVHRMGQPNPPTAVFAVNDTLAQNLMKGLAESGIVVPRDISVVGFDDDPLAARTEPALTTVGMGKRDLGAISAKMVLERMKDSGKAPAHHVQPTRLVIRDSVAKI